MGNDRYGWGALGTLVLMLGAVTPTLADEQTRWVIHFEPVFMQAEGNDRHVLTMHETQGAAVQSTGTRLDTESGVAPRLELRYVRGSWSYGLDFTNFLTSQDVGPTGAAAGGGVDEVEFEVSGASYVSGGPSEVLYYDTLGDTDLETWLLDLYAMRSLASGEGVETAVQLGLRFADFDNDYHGQVGLENVAGTFIDASSNYPRMAGPLIGLAAKMTRGRHECQGYVSQSVVFGTADLSSSRRDFTGAPASPTVIDSQAFRVDHEESIPITELRFRWTYRINDLVHAGAGVHSAVWWGVSVPPGVTPGSGGVEALDEETIVMFGVSGFVGFRF